jgi:hypothetical protein
MSASLVVLLPVILLGIVSLLCFVGCVLNTHGLPPSFTQYSTTTVLGNLAVVAYWPLNEANDTVPAADLTPNPDNGQYIDPTTLPAIYPWPDFSIADSPTTNIESAAAGFGTMAAAGFGTISFAQPGIVTGDFGTNDTDSNSSGTSPCLVVNGCFVNVPLASKINPPTSFTLEAWVRVDWSANDPHAWRAVLDARDNNPSTGFAIFAKADDNAPGVYHWNAMIGNGTGFTAVESADPPITLKDPSSAAGTSFYLAVTYDGPSQTLTLFVDGLPSGPAVTSAVYVPNTTKPLFIGAGVPFGLQRPQPAGVVAGPLFPFVGALQDVAIYNAALAPGVILTHLHNGSGFNP